MYMQKPKPELSRDEKRVVERLRQLANYSSEAWFRERRQPLLSEAFAATGDTMAVPNIDGTAGVAEDGYRFIEFWVEAEAPPPWRDGYVAAVPAAASPAARVIVADTSGHVLITRGPVPLGARDAFTAAVRLSVFRPWPGRCGTLRYHRDADAIVPASVGRGQWLLLGQPGRNPEPFQGSCRLLALVLLVGGTVLWAIGRVAALGAPVQPISAVVAALILGASGELWRSARLWLRNLARWTAVLTAGLLLGAEAIPVFEQLRRLLEGRAVFGWALVSDLISLALGVLALGLLVLFWPCSAGRNWILAARETHAGEPPRSHAGGTGSGTGNDGAPAGLD